MPTSLTTLANVYSELGKPVHLNKSIELHKQALKIREEKLGSEHPSVAITLNNWGVAYASLNDAKNLITAIDMHKRALIIQEKFLNGNHIEIATSKNNMANAYSKLGGPENLNTAIVLYHESLKMREKLLGEDHVDVAESLTNLAEAYVLVNQIDSIEKALTLYQRALKIRQEKMGKEHPTTISCLERLPDVELILLKLRVSQAFSKSTATKNDTEASSKNEKKLMGHVRDERLLETKRPGRPDTQLASSPSLALNKAAATTTVSRHQAMETATDTATALSNMSTFGYASIFRTKIL